MYYKTGNILIQIKYVIFSFIIYDLEDTPKNQQKRGNEIPPEPYSLRGHVNSLGYIFPVKAYF